MNRRLIFLLVAVLAVKAIFLALDSQPSFHFADSGVYLATAIGKWIPPHRSFVYGLLLRPVTVWPRTLASMVLLQAALSGIASWLVGVCLVRYFGTRFTIAAVCSLGCAVEPLQLAAERRVLTESVATFIFAVFLLTAFSYLKTSSISTLAFVQIIGVLLVSTGLRFLPIVLVLSCLLPVVSRRAISFWRSSHGFRIQWVNAVRFVLLPLLLSVVLSQSLLFAYRHLHEELLDRPPVYTNRARGGEAGSMEQLRLAASRYIEDFRYEMVRRNLQLEGSHYADALPGETQAVKVTFGIDVEKPSGRPLTEIWEENSAIWCWFVMALPVFFAIYVAVRWRRIRAVHVVCAICGLILLFETVLPPPYATSRGLTTLAWLEILIIGALATAVRERKGATLHAAAA